MLGLSVGSIIKRSIPTPPLILLGSCRCLAGYARQNLVLAAEYGFQRLAAVEGGRMMLSSHGLAIAALCATSLLVRVLPVFVRPRLNATARELVERVLPLAVFINFAVYIAWTEIRTAPVPAIASIALVALASFFTRFGLVTITCAATLVYALVTMAWPV